MTDFKNILEGGDLRSIGRSNEVVSLINNQEQFDDLFELLFERDRMVVMRAADAIEKVSLHQTSLLASHKYEIISLCKTVSNIELKWHLALLVSRLQYAETELPMVWQLLMTWATQKNESHIVRVNALQSLYNLLVLHPAFETDFAATIAQIEKENIPSVNARIRKFRKAGFHLQPAL